MGTSASQLERQVSQLLPNTSDRYFGLENYGNTCYANSVLQALYHCVPFRLRILRFYERVVELDLVEQVQSQPHTLWSIAQLFYTISTQKRVCGYIGPSAFMRSLQKHNALFVPMQHQDAHEFWNFVVNDCADAMTSLLRCGDDALADVCKSTRGDAIGHTVVHSVFEGVLSNQTKCMCCETISSREESFFDLSVDIKENMSVSACLKAFSSLETLSLSDKFHCDVCRSPQEAQKRMLVKRLPPILVIHLKRFKYDERVGAHQKLGHRVVFPMELRVWERMREKGRGRGDDDDDDTDDDDDALYTLRAVVVHRGAGPSQGHYVTAVRSNALWFLFNDDRLIRTEQLQSFFGSAYGASGAGTGYLLFYDSEVHQ